MKPTEPDMPSEVEELELVAEPARAQHDGAQDDDDDRDDEHDDENEIPVRERDDRTEAPEEFRREDEFVAARR